MHLAQAMWGWPKQTNPMECQTNDGITLCITGKGCLRPSFRTIGPILEPYNCSSGFIKKK